MGEHHTVQQSEDFSDNFNLKMFADNQEKRQQEMMRLEQQMEEEQRLQAQLAAQAAYNKQHLLSFVVEVSEKNTYIHLLIYPSNAFNHEYKTIKSQHLGYL